MKGTIVQQMHRYDKYVRHTCQKQQYSVEKPTVKMPYARVELNRLLGSRDTAARQASAIGAISIQFGVVEQILLKCSDVTRSRSATVVGVRHLHNPNRRRASIKLLILCDTHFAQCCGW